ncbi:MAG: hypothetical protein NT150_09015 [Bacteroidetes bacterium]|nr:hypothetical protein [Bacteroidota bacterium]
MKKLNGLLLLLFVITISKGYSQIGFTAYRNWAIGINSSTSKKVSVDVKFFLNNALKSTPTELNLMYNLAPKTYHRISFGLGLNFTPLRGYDEINFFAVPILLEFYPLQKFKQLSLALEFAPVFLDSDNAAIRYMAGLRYTFSPLSVKGKKDGGTMQGEKN